MSPGFPTSDDHKRGLYNSIAHAVAVVGLSTSVFLEAGILNRPVGLLKTLDTIDNSVFNKSFHFEYLLRNNFPTATDNEADCARWLAQLAEGHADGEEARRQFVSHFFRPQGIDRPSAKVAAEAILELAKAE